MFVKSKRNITNQEIKNKKHNSKERNELIRSYQSFEKNLITNDEEIVIREIE